MRRFPLRASALSLVLACAAGCARSGRAPVRLAAPAGPMLSTAEFGALVSGLSEAGGFFPSDNFVSNELSYLHVLGAMRTLRVSGGAYIGVGPDQSFSYIAAIRPEIAFIIDIRRDNLLQHLLFKAAFESARNRLEYLAFLLGRRLPADPAAWDSASIEDIVRYVDSVPAEPALFAHYDSLALMLATASGIALDVQDTANLSRIHRAFFQMGLEIRYSNRGRFGFGGYPSWRQLIFEADLEGSRLNYLTSAERYAFVRDLERRNLIIPVVGDLSGPHALVAIGDELRLRGLAISAFYASNVEQYLFQQGGFPTFARNVAGLPRAPNSVFIRSYFRGRHPRNVPGYASTQLLGSIDDFVTEFNAGMYRSYSDLVLRNTIPPERVPARARAMRPAS